MQPQDLVGRRVDDVFDDRELRDSLSEPEEIDGESYFGSRALGVEFVVQDARVTTAHIHVLPEGDYVAYADDLPCRLGRDMTRQAVREILGTPIACGEPTRMPVLGDSPAWDLFEVDCLWLNVSYRLDGPGLSLLAFMVPGAVSI